MTCNESAEFISALYDGELVPPPVAEHIGACETCRDRLHDYITMGTELRRIASLESPAQAKPRSWAKPQTSLHRWWHEAWHTMRIPRLAFVALLAALAVLGSSLTMVRVRAHAQGTVILLKIATAAGQSTLCPLSATDTKWQECAFMGQVNAHMLSYKINLLSATNDRIEVAFRSDVAAVTPGSWSMTYDTLGDLPARTYSFEPGQSLDVDVAGLGPLTITGEWIDHIPNLAGGTADLDPGPGQLRITSPLLLRDKQVIADFAGSSASAQNSKQAVVIYIPGQGKFKLSLTPSPAAIPAHAQNNRIAFNIDGRPYAFVTASPVTRDEQVWILHDPDWKPSGESATDAFIGLTSLSGSL